MTDPRQTNTRHDKTIDKQTLDTTNPRHNQHETRQTLNMPNV